MAHEDKLPPALPTQCALHDLRLTGMEKRLDTLDGKTDKLTAIATRVENKLDLAAQARDDQDRRITRLEVVVFKDPNLVQQTDRLTQKESVRSRWDWLLIGAVVSQAAVGLGALIWAGIKYMATGGASPKP